MRKSLLSAIPAAGLVLSLIPQSALAWGSHYLVSDRALEHPDFHCADKEVSSESLEDFLRDQGKYLSRIFADHYDWLLKKGSKRFKVQTFNGSAPTVAEFLKAARLNPDTRFQEAIRVFPGEEPKWNEMPTQFVIPGALPAGGLVPRFQSTRNHKVSARAVFATASDEPDWRMDFGLWDIVDYGYGTIPYGSKDGEAEKAAFHILYRHENWIVKLFAPEMLDGLVADRVDLFSRLSMFAFSSHHDYWGYRFAAWAAHYIQDLRQPYHSKAIPSANWFYYLKFMISPDKARIKKETTQIVKNRHFAYEDFVAFELEQSYVNKEDKVAEHLSRFLSRGLILEPGSREPLNLVIASGDAAALHAAVLDKAIVQTFGPRMTEDPSYDLESDASYSVSQFSRSLAPEAAGTILNETGQDFEHTGRLTRTLLQTLIGGSCD